MSDQKGVSVEEREAVVAFNRQAGVYLNKIAALLNGGHRLTLLARHESRPSMNLLLSNDDLTRATEALQQRDSWTSSVMGPPEPTLPPIESPVVGVDSRGVSKENE